MWFLSVLLWAYLILKVKKFSVRLIFQPYNFTHLNSNFSYRKQWATPPVLSLSRCFKCFNGTFSWLRFIPHWQGVVSQMSLWAVRIQTYIFIYLHVYIYYIIYSFGDVFAEYWTDGIFCNLYRLTTEKAAEKADIQKFSRI